MATPNQNQTTSIGDDIAEGKALGKMWRQLNSLKQTVKANGFDTKIMKQVIKLKKLDKASLAEQEAILDLYRAALEI